MKLAVYGKKITAEAREDIENLHSILIESGVDFKVFHRLNSYIKEHCDLGLEFEEFRTSQELLEYAPDFLITIGGDGTILDAATLVRDSGIPILGINTGRLGFLSNVNRQKIEESLEALFRKDYQLSHRRLLHMESKALDLDLPFALNEITVSRKDTTAMVTVEVSINGEFFNNYWADGLIIATPTGSTGYSLSCNGPIMMPGSETLVLTPIAPHNLTARPFVIPNSCEIELKVHSREEWNLVSLDSRIYSIRNGEPLKIRKADFSIALVETADHTFAKTLRNKLMWGMDKRN
ncbi:NAD kinase [Croceimicrobium hydrocarbonivorans]|uniref:NAD kinase n=1 Tax=Croceimicrobium hydrocarbonivorans TaxID=2761580 RepID=A0A7H0VI70_9FLAO|nr:NAD kinase [Croceimicrobium hydrocarbonivorans]QNR25418.1 NAD kinase [Croceimicrobium hydrocarbonivorans]